MTHRPFRALLLVVAALVLVACASRDRTPGARAFQHGRFGEARQFFEGALAEETDDTALDRSDAGVAALAEGDVDGAFRHFREAYDEFDDLSASTGETIGAMVGPERSKRWRGDPVDRCMNAYYLGVTYWLRGDVDNAAASFKAGLLRDGDSSEEGGARSDFALLHLLAGLAAREAHHEGGGDGALRAAAALLPDAPFVKGGTVVDANVVIVVDRGIGPRRVAKGPGGAWLEFRRTDRALAAPSASEDGRTVARGATAVDVFQQATTRGSRTMDTVNQAKAAAKTAAQIGGVIVLDQARNDRERLLGAGLLLAGLITPSEADIRTWLTLPAEVSVLLADLPEGEHDLRLDFGDGTAEMVHVTAHAGRVTFVWTRDVRGAAVLTSER